MKRKTPLLLVAVLLLSMVWTPVNQASAAYLPSQERGEDNSITIDDADVPLLELPTAEITSEAVVDGNGTAVVTVTAEQMLAAVETVANGEAVRITVAPTGTEGADSVSATMPKEALQAVVEQTDAELAIVTDAGQMTLPNAAIASIVEKAEGEDVTFNMARQVVEYGKELLEEILGTSMDISEERILGGSVTEVNILSGGRNITNWGGGAASLTLPTGKGLFEEGKGYTVLQISADKSRTEHVGRCVMGAKGLHVEISITHLSTFVVLAEAVEENVGIGSTPLVASPLTAGIDTTVGSSTGTQANLSYLWFGAAGLCLAAAVTAGVVSKQRRKS